MNCNLAVIKGDGIGPEIVTEAMRVLDAVGEKYGHTFSYTQILMGGASIDVHGEPLTEEALEIAKKSDAVLMGSIGGNTSTSPWYKLPAQLRPEAGLLKLRKSLGLFANIRPAYLYDELKKACPLRDEVIGDGFDMVIMRELTGGLYFGERHTEEIDGVRTAVDTLSYNENEIRRIAIKAFDIARKRKKHVISVDKANVLDSSRLWRTVVEEVAKDVVERARLMLDGDDEGDLVRVFGDLHLRGDDEEAGVVALIEINIFREDGEPVEAGCGAAGDCGLVLPAVFGDALCAPRRGEIRLERPVSVLIEEGAALAEALRMGIDGVDVVQGRAGNAKKVVLDLHQLLSDDGTVVFLDEVVDFGDAAGRGILDGQDPVVDGAVFHGFHDVFK